MADDPKTQGKDKKPEGSTTQQADDKGKGKTPDSADELTKLKAAHDASAAELRVIKKERDDLTVKSSDQDKKLKILEAEKTSKKETGEQIADLQTELARSKAVSKFGLNEEDAERLTGSPEQILQDAEYWSKRTTTEDKKKAEDDDKKKADEGEGDKLPPRPKAKKGDEDLMERYEKASSAERKKIEDDIRHKRVDAGFSK